jgi:peroxiredoxin Q/BCP
MTHLKAKMQAPDFTVNDQDGKPVSLKDYKGKKVALLFYPQDNTPTCTIEACNIRDNYSKLKKRGYVVLGISPDSEKKHRNFIKKFSLPYILLCDPDKVVHNLYGVWAQKTTFGKTYMGTLRTTFIIDEEGMISRVIDKVESKRHTAQILEPVI